MEPEFEWDDAKRAANLDKHDIDFEDAIDVFDGRPANTIPSMATEEERYVTTAIVQGRFMTVIWTLRNGRTRIISARRTRDAEKREYHKKTGVPNP